MKKIIMMTLMMCLVLGSYSQSSFKFSTELTKLPVNFQGLQTDKTYNFLFNIFKIVNSAKDEFETSIAYEKRVENNYNKLNNKFLYFSGDVDSEYSKSLIYDIDSLKMTVYIQEILKGRINYNGDYERNVLILDGGTFERLNYTTTNAYNASVNVTGWNSISYNISNCEFLDSISNMSFVLNNIQPIEAKELKTNFKFLVIGNLISPFLEIGREIKEPTFSDPHERNDYDMSFFLDIKELWFYNKKSGKIYIKINKLK
jgi:hypothetical protein